MLSRVLEREAVESAHLLETEDYRRAGVSTTFEGRDVFAPAAAWLLRGIAPETFGPAAGELVRLSLAGPPLTPGRPTVVRVLMVDRFGNVTLAVTQDTVGERQGLRVETRGDTITRLLRAYADARDDRPFLLFNSAGHLEIAMREQSASARLGLDVGDEVLVTLEPGSPTGARG